MRSAEIKMRNGFCLKSLLTLSETRYVLDKYPDARTEEIGSVRMSGGKHYSIHDLVGYSVQGMVYVVKDLPIFRSVMAMKLEKDFLDRNPNSERGMRAAFTAFMHENKLHWSGCCRTRGSGIAQAQAREIVQIRAIK
jgi:hypothetical protein